MNRKKEERQQIDVQKSIDGFAKVFQEELILRVNVVNLLWKFKKARKTYVSLAELV